MGFLDDIEPLKQAALVELIAAIPSVVIGLWGVMILGSFLRDVIEIPIVTTFGDLPLLGSAASGSDLDLDTPGEVTVETDTPEANDGVVSFIGLAGSWAGTGSLSCSPVRCDFVPAPGLP